MQSFDVALVDAQTRVTSTYRGVHSGSCSDQMHSECTTTHSTGNTLPLSLSLLWHTHSIGEQVGKGRQLAGIMLENFLHGRRKHVWISVGNDLAFDARRDLDDLGCGRPDDLDDDEDDDDESSSEDEESSQSSEEEEGEESSQEEEEEEESSGGRQRKKRKGRGGEGGSASSSTSSSRARRGVAVAAAQKLSNQQKKEKKRSDEKEAATIKRREQRRREKEEAKRKERESGVDRRGGVFIDSFQQNKHGYGTIQDGDGVMFLTYSSLVAANRDGKSRLKQVRFLSELS